MFKNVLATPPHPGVRSVRPHLFQKDDLPDSAPVFGTVTGSGLDPIALGILGIQDGAYRGVFSDSSPGLYHLRVVFRVFEEMAKGEISDRRI
jgi:hypothetical protein